MKKSAQNFITPKGSRLIKITFPFAPETLAEVKQLSGRKYNPEFRYWTCPYNLESVEVLKTNGFTLCPVVDKFYKMKKEKAEEKQKIQKIEIPGLGGTLRPFQEIGAATIYAWDGNALLADEMGLGKTVQTLAWLQKLQKQVCPILIICPATLKMMWKNEIKKWLDWEPIVEILSGKTGSLINKETDICIINYDILTNDYKKTEMPDGKIAYTELKYSGWVDHILTWSPKTMITDECQNYKNNSAKRTKAVMKIGKHCAHNIPISGTPIDNNTLDIYNAVKLVDPTLFPDPWRFKMRYCGAKHNGFGWDFSGSSNEEELFEKLQTIMIRRLKKDVEKELPPKVKTAIPIELNNRKEYEKAEKQFLAYIAEKIGTKYENIEKELKEKAKQYGVQSLQIDTSEQMKQEVFEKIKKAKSAIFPKIEELKQIAVRGKLSQTIEWIENFLESGEKLIVFANHTFVIDALMKAFPKISVKIDGSVPPDKRETVKEQFQTNPKVKLFVGNIKAAGVGITLTAASNVVFLELPWTPGALDQAEDRAHRITQTKVVTIYYLLAENTVEGKIAAILDKKREIRTSVLDGKQVEESDMIVELLKMYQ